MWFLYIIITLIGLKLFLPRFIKEKVREKITSTLNQKGFMPIWIFFCISFVFIMGLFIVPAINEKTPEELEQIKNTRLEQRFYGIILDKPCCDHSFNMILTDTSKQRFNIQMSPKLDSIGSKGDSIKKEFGNNYIYVKPQNTQNWIKIEYVK